jgi:prepilin-type N-terminal cleavage/methylation domain-containing protein
VLWQVCCRFGFLCGFGKLIVRMVLNKNKKQAGFTIVELLIVIVVIGVLAAIVTVAYYGVQAKAQQAQLLAGVDAYEKALRNYYTINGSYPVAVGPAYTCIGDDWPASPPFSAGSCGIVNGAIINVKNDALNTALKTQFSILPSSRNAVLHYNDGTNDVYMRGIRYLSDGNSAQLIFMTSNDQVCGRGVKSMGSIGGVAYTYCSIVMQ